MKKAILVLLLVAGSSTAMAEKLTCSFTEPFFDVEYDSQTGELIRDGYNFVTNKTEREVLARDVKVVRIEDKHEGLLVDYPVYELRMKSWPLARLTLNYQGSNGMSDAIFPYDMQFFGNPNDKMPATSYGGCESDTLKAYVPTVE